MTTTKTVLSTSDANLDSTLTLPLPFVLATGRYAIVRWKPTSTNSFSFNFTEGEGHSADKNTAFHFNPRLASGVVVKNAKLANVGWGAEERGGGMPYELGVTSETKLVVREDFFECFVNGAKHADFNHRTPIESVKFLFIYGNGEVESVVFGDEAAEQDPTADLTTPYETPCDISPGRKIYFSAIPDADVNRFWVFLCADDDYVFVLIVKMKRKIVSINTRISRSWKNKQRVKEFPFEVGQLCNIVIEVEADKFKVSVNDNHLADFSHRVLPLSRINKLRVDERDGKLQLKRVDIE